MSRSSYVRSLHLIGKPGTLPLFSPEKIGEVSLIFCVIGGGGNEYPQQDVNHEPGAVKQKEKNE
jgi:hypothetical protein